MCNKSLSMVRGDTCTLPFDISCGSADLSLEEEDVGFFALVHHDGSVVLKKSLSPADCNADGDVCVVLYPEDTAQLAPGLYAAELELTISGEVVTPFRGTMRIWEDHITPEVKADG